MEHCINLAHSEVKELAKQLNTHPAVLASKIAVWQETNNNFDRFPTAQELSEISDTKQKAPIVFNSEQKEAISKATEFIKSGNPKEWLLIQGKAGTGKTTIAEQIVKQFPGKSIYVAALSNKAKGVIQQTFNKAKVKASFHSIASLLGQKMDLETGRFERKPDDFSEVPIENADIIVLDEGSMVNEEALELIFKHKPNNAKVIVLADIGQLPPIRTLENPYYHGKEHLFEKESPVFNTQNKSILTTRVRQGEESPILPYADHFWNNSQSANPELNPAKTRENIITDKGALLFTNDFNSIKEQVVPLFKKAVDTGNPNYIKVVTYRNNIRETINAYIHKSLFGDKEFNKGEIIIFNDSYGDIENSTETQIQEISELKEDKNGLGYYVAKINYDDEVKSLLVLQSKDKPKFQSLISQKFNEARALKGKPGYRAAMSDAWEFKKKFANVDYGYAITSHKSQGSTYDNVIVNEKDITGVGPISNKSKSQSIYTAITRARNTVTIISSAKIDNPIDNIGSVIDKFPMTVEHEIKQEIPVVQETPEIEIPEITIQSYTRPDPITFSNRKEVSEEQINHLIQGITYHVANTVFKTPELVKQFVTPNEDGVRQVPSIDLEFIRTKLYNGVYTTLLNVENQIEELESKRKPTEESSELEGLYKKRDNLTDIIKDVLGYELDEDQIFQQTEQPRNFLLLFQRFQKNLESIGLKFDKEEEDVFEEALSNSNVLASVPAMYLDPKKSMSAVIRVLLSTIQKKDKFGATVINSLGQIVPLSSSEAFNTLAIHLTENLPQGNFEKQQERIRELVKSRPEFSKILELLGNTHNNAELTEENLRTEFTQIFSQTKLNFLNGVIQDHIHRLLDANQETVAKKIKAIWRSTYLEKITRDDWSKTKSELIKLNKSLKFNGVWTPELITNIKTIFRHLGLNDISDETIKADYNNGENIIKVLDWIVDTGLKRESLMFNRPQDKEARKIDVTGRINQIVNEEAKHSPEVADLQVMDEKGKPMYGVALNTYMSELIQELNYYATHDQEELLSKYNWLFNNGFTQHSILADHLKSSKEIKLSVYKSYSSDESSMSISGLDIGGMTSADMISVFNNQYSVPVTGDREVKILYSIGKEILSYDTASLDTETYLLNHLKAELEAATADNLNIQYLEKKIGKLRLLNDIFGKDPLVQAKLKLTLTRQEIEEFVKLNENNLRAQIKSWLEDYNKRVDKFFSKQRLKDTYKVSKKEGDTIYNTEIPNFIRQNNKDLPVNQEQAIKYYGLVKLVSLIEAQKFFFGDPAIYKSGDDAMKRFSMFTGTKQVSRTDRAFNEWLQHKMNIKIDNLDEPTLSVWTVADPLHKANDEVKIILERQKEEIKKDLDKVKIPQEQKDRLLKVKYESLEKAYNDFKLADSQGYANDDLVREIKLRAGKWGPLDEIIYQKLKQETKVSNKEQQRLQSLKTQYVGPMADRDDFIPTSLKHAILRLNKELVKGTMFEEAYKIMEEGKANIIQMGSGVKFGAVLNDQGKLDDLFIDKKVNPNPQSVHRIYWKFFGEQQELAPVNKTEGTAGVQPRKLGLQNIYNQGEIQDKSLAPIVKRYEDTQKLVFENQWQDWLKEAKLGIQKIKDKEYYIINDRKALVESLLRVIESRMTSNNTTAAIESFIDEHVLLDALPGKRKLESILLSPIRQALSREHRNGGMRVLTAHHGFEFSGDNLKTDNTLKFYTSDGVNPTTPCEVDLPVAFNQYLKPGDKIIFFRVPATGLASMDVAVVRKFVTGGDFIMASPLLLPKTNADHDVDKVIMFLPNYDRNKQYVSSQGNSKAAIENRLLEITTQLILHPSRFKDLTTPVGAGIIQSKGIELGYVTDDDKARDKDNEFSGLKDFMINFDKAYQFHSGKGLISNLSIYTTMFPLMQKSGIYINEPDENINLFMSHNTMTVNGVVYPSMSNILDVQGNRIMELFTETTQHSMDVQNKPTISELGINEYTIGVVSFLHAIGTPVEAIQRLLNHQVVKAYVQAQRVNDRPSRDRGYLNPIEPNLNKYTKGLIEKFIKDEHLKLNYNTLLSTLAKSNQEDPATIKLITEHKNHLKEISENHSFEDGKTIIGDNSFREEVFEMYLEYERYAQKYTKFALSSRPDADATGGTNIEAFKANIERRREVITENWFGNVDKFFNDTFLAPIHHHTDKMYHAFDHMILALNQGTVSPSNTTEFSDILKQFKARYMGFKTGKKREKYLNLVDSDFATNILMHPKSPFGYDKNKHLFELNPDYKTVGERLIEFKQPTSSISQNPVIKILTVLTDEKLQSVVVGQRSLDIETENSVVSGYEELLNNTDLEIKQFAKDLLTLSIIQGGLGLNYYTLTGILPVKTLIEATTPLLTNFLNQQDKSQWLDNFQNQFIIQNPKETFRARGRGFRSEEPLSNASLKYVYKQDGKTNQIYLLENTGKREMTKNGLRVIFEHIDGVTPEPNQKSEKIKKYWAVQQPKKIFKSAKEGNDNTKKPCP